jgi:hypothetical protein
MVPIIELAVAVGRLSRRDSREIVERYSNAGIELETLLEEGGYLDRDEYDWLAQMALQGYDIEDLEKFQRQWFLAWVALSEGLLPSQAETLPRLLLKNWAQRRGLTLAKLLEEKGFSSESIFRASQLLASQLTICLNCLSVLRVRLGVRCPICQGGQKKDKDHVQQLWDLYRCLSTPNPGLNLNVDFLEQNALDLLKRFENG